MIQIRRQGSAAIIELDGKLVFGEPVVEFRSRWAEVLSTGASPVILDLSRVPYIDSSGIGTLVRCQAPPSGTAGKNPGGGNRGASRKLKVVGAPTAVRNTLKVARVDSFFEYYETVEAALAANNDVAGNS